MGGERGDGWVAGGEGEAPAGDRRPRMLGRDCPRGPRDEPRASFVEGLRAPWRPLRMGKGFWIRFWVGTTADEVAAPETGEASAKY